MAACNDMQRHACNDMDQHEAAREMVHMLRAELQDTRALVRQHQYHHQQQQETAGKSLETTYELQQQVHQQHEELQSRWAEVKELRAEVQAAALASTSLTQQLHQLTLQHSKLQSRLQAGEQHAASVGEALDAAEREKTALATDRDELRAGAKSQMALAAQETERLKKLLKVGSSCLVLLLLCCSCCFVSVKHGTCGMRHSKSMCHERCCLRCRCCLGCTWCLGCLPPLPPPRLADQVKFRRIAPHGLLGKCFACVDA